MCTGSLSKNPAAKIGPRKALAVTGRPLAARPRPGRPRRDGPPPRSRQVGVVAGAGHDEHPAVDVEHVDVVAVELAEHVGADHLLGSSRSPRGRPPGRRSGPSPAAAGSSRGRRSGPRRRCSRRSARAARRPPGRCAGRGWRAARRAAAAAARLISAWAIRIRCCSPPESRPTRVVGERRGVDRGEHLLDALAPRARGRREAERLPVEPEPDQVAAAQRHVGVEQELLRHVADQPGCAASAAGRRPGSARARRLQPEDHPEERRLAGAVGADQPGELAGGDREVDRRRGPGARRAARRAPRPRAPPRWSPRPAPELLRRLAVADRRFERLQLGQHPALVGVAGRHRLVDADHRHAVVGRRRRGTFR